MRQARVLLPLSVAVFLFAGLAFSQDAQTLADAARQARQQKAKTTQAPAKDAPVAKTPKIITNDEIPSHLQPVARVSTADPDRTATSASYARNDGKVPAEVWKSQIEGQKNLISSMQGQIDQLSESIRFASANCVSNCAQWNERQREKQQQVEQMKAQLADQQKRLEDMQEQARRQGYGSSVYEP